MNGIVYSDTGEPLYRDIGSRRNYFHNGKEYVHNWFTATTQADAAWNDAKELFWNEMYEGRRDLTRQHSARLRIDQARASYRSFVLSWYRTLCLPMKIGECVPSMVAVLLAEEWDERTALREIARSK